uniref:Uncharacterized protein n=1 Tax=Arundo donax TaxID=35708 RepID=A0A0A9A5B0_ARUDO
MFHLSRCCYIPFVKLMGGKGDDLECWLLVWHGFQKKDNCLYIINTPKS